MISKLNIRNFKVHRDTELDIGGLTVLSGINSSGKSSILQALLLLRQSYLKGRLSDGLELNGPLCRLGTWQDVVYRFADTGKISIDIQDGDTYPFNFDVDSSPYTSFAGKANELPYPSTTSLGNLALFGNNFQYVSSLRGGGNSHYNRYDYEVEAKQQISVDLGQGEAVAHYLHKFGPFDRYNYLDEDFGEQIPLAEQVEGWEQKISPNIKIDVQKDPSGGFNILYGYAKEGIRTITDLRAENVGYGISHSLPVVAALVSAQPGSLILLENPEAQLHPRGQTELAMLICRAVQHGVQVIVETHSDHILNGILLASVLHDKGKHGIDRNNVRLYHFQKDEDTQTFACPIRVDIADAGRLENQPKDFFDQEECVFFKTQALLNNDN